MKNLFRLIMICFLFAFFSFEIMAQESDQKELELMATYHDGDMLLRWIPTNYKTWKKSCDNGLKLVRVHVGQNSVDTLVLASDIKPLSEAQWSAQFPNNQSADLAKNILYNNTEDIIEIQTMKDVWDVQQQKESKHLFSMVVAEHDFEVAIGLALGFKDSDIVEGDTYGYILTVNDQSEPLVANFNLKAEEALVFPTVKSVKGMSTEKEVFIEWDDKATQSFYTTFEIERSSDSLIWGKCNEAPFMNIETTQEGFEEGDLRATFKDVPPTDEEYYYRVKGKTPFGFFGPPSKVVKIGFAPKKLLFNLDFDGYEEIAGLIKLNWNSLETVYNDSLAGFNVYRSKSGNSNPIRINESLIGSSERDFTDSSPLAGDTYYYLEGVDHNNYSYRSLELLVRIEDHEAPEKVVGLSHSFLDYNNVELNWEASDAEDLRGYHVHVSTARNGKYSMATKNAIKATTFVYSITENIAFDSLFFKIAAEDKRRNIAEHSDVLAIPRPDVFGPAKPVLAYANPLPDGIYLDWQYSASDDVVKHELRRRKRDGNDKWVTVLEVSEQEKDNYNDNTNSNYQGNFSFLDSTELYNEYYSYWFFAIDDAGNESGSKLIDVLPYKSAIDGAVTNFELDLVTYNEANSSSITDKIKILSKNYKNVESRLGGGEKYDLELKWDAELDASLSHFLIYRSIGDSGLNPVKSLTPEEGLGIDGDVDFTADSGIQTFRFVEKKAFKNKRYTYYIVRVERDGTESKRSSILSKRIPTE